MEKEKLVSFVETPKPIINLMIQLISKEKNSIKKDLLVLDAGMGKGLFINCLLEAGFEKITGIEINKELFEYCISKFPQKEGLSYYNNDFLTWNPPMNFDIIIGNPPYVHFNDLPEKLQKEVYEITNTRESDIYYAFIMKAIQLLRWNNSELIFIVPYGFFYNTYAKVVREMLSEWGYIDTIIDLDEARIFKGEHPETVIFKFIRINNKKDITEKPMKILRIKDKNAKPNEIYKYAIDSLHQRRENTLFSYYVRPTFPIPNEIWSTHPRISISYYEILKDIAIIGVGLVSGFDQAFRLFNGERDNFTNKEKETIYPFMKGVNCKGFWVEGYSDYILLDPYVKEETKLKEEYPNIYQKIIKYKEKMSSRYMPKNKQWFHWQALRNKGKVEKWILKPKIFVPTLDRSKTNRFSLTYNPLYPSGDVLIIIPMKINPFLLLGYLNSNFFREYYLAYGGRRGHRIAFTQKLLSEMKIPIFSQDTIKKIIETTEEIYNIKNTSKRSLIDEFIKEEFGINT